MRQPTEIAKVSPAFQWDPPPGTKEPSQKLTIALVSPRVAEESRLGGYEGKQYFDLFVRAIHTDTNRALLEKGFTVTGPFPSLEEMTYPDKKAAPLALTPEVVIVLDETYTVNRNEDLGMGALGGSRVIERKGTLTATALVKFVIVEPMSGQTIWLKRVDIPESSATIEVDLLVDYQGNPNPYHRNVDNSDAVVVQVLNQAYPEILKKFWNYLNAEEIAVMRKAADEVRSRKVF